MYGYTYLTYDTEKNKVYVGQHKSETYDKKYYGSGTIIRRIIKKRKDTLRNYVLEWCDTLEHLNESEMRWIEYFREEFGEENCYNLCDGGDGTKGHKLSEETKRKLSDGNKGHTLTEETKRKLSESLKGHQVTEQTRRKIGDKNKGSIRTEEQRKLISERTKEAMNRSDVKEKFIKGIKTYYETHEPKKGWKPSEETRRKWSEIRKGKNMGENNKSSVKVKNTETGQIWDCIRECADFYGVTRKVIYDWLKKGKNNLIRL